MTSKATGQALLLTSLISFAYYTFWVLVTVPPTQPFIDEDHWLQAYFPERKWAILVPTAVGVVILSGTVTFLGLIVVRSSTKP
jgi:dolichyl-phosphate mannosyltransferase polypeptide 2 regulatory subunit